MFLYTPGHIASITSGTVSGIHERPVMYLSIDSRKITFPADTCFFALKTSSRNGHQFICEVYQQGVRTFVASEPVATESFPGAAFIAVDDSLIALQQIAAFHRSRFQLPVVGITGSNGKTIVKEWLYEMLHDVFDIVRSPKSYNSQIGVPLSIWQIQPGHTLGIFEAGISRPDEMQPLQQIIQPTIGILTNIGAAHDEGFADREEKLREKLLLFRQVSVLICSYNDLLVRQEVEKLNVPKFAWGHGEDCQLRVLQATKTDGKTRIELRFRGETHQYELGFTDEASLENAIHGLAVLYYLGVDVASIQERLSRLHPVAMRLEWKRALNNCFLLNDSYSNDLSSLVIALNYLDQQQRGNRTTVILSDFYESGLGDQDLYDKVATLLRRHKVSRLFAVGEHISQHESNFKAQGLAVVSCQDTAGFIKDFDEALFFNEDILLKGARKFGFERIAALFEYQLHQTVLEINLTALAHNLQQFRRLVKPGVKMMVMVKAFGYGSGDAEIARVLQFNKVDYLAVAYTDEGVALRKAGIHLPVMVMNSEEASFENIVNHKLEPEIYSFNLLNAFSKFCFAEGIEQYPVHIKMDTGMHRLGFESSELPALAAALVPQHNLLVQSVFTHFAASEDPSFDEFTRQQAARFAEGCHFLQEQLGYAFIRHADNTAAIQRHAASHFDMVRLGIGLYGVATNAENLRVVSTLKTRVAQVKKLPAGETVGYGRKGKLENDAVIATVNIGYADGFRRSLGNGNGEMWVKGKLVAVVGNVSMDMTMIDVTGIDVKAGDEVEVFGENIPVSQLADRCGTIPYEIMTGIGQRVKRVYLEE